MREPELAFLRLQVYDRDSIANDFVGYHVISLQSLEEGGHGIICLFDTTAPTPF